MHLDVYGTPSPHAPSRANSDEIHEGVRAEYEFCHTICPQTAKNMDTAHTKYADDMVKTILGPVPDYHRHAHMAEQEALEGLIRRAEASSLLFSQSLEEFGYAQNTKKTHRCHWAKW